MRKILSVLVLLVVGFTAFAFDDFIFVTNNTSLERTIEVTYTYPQSGLHYNDTRHWTITVEPGETLKFETKANLSRNGKYKISIAERENGEIFKIQSKWNGEDIIAILEDFKGEIYRNISVKEFLEENHMVLETSTFCTKSALKRGFSPIEKFTLIEYKRGLITCYDDQLRPLYQVMAGMDKEYVLSMLKGKQ